MATFINGGILLDDAGILQCSTSATPTRMSQGWQGWPTDVTGTVCIVLESSQARFYLGGFAFETSSGKLIYTETQSDLFGYIRGVGVTSTGAVVTADSGTVLGYAEGMALVSGGGIKVSGSATVPAAPTIGTATAGNVTAVITWTDNSDGGSAITSHNIISSPATTTQHGSSGMTFTGLTNGTAYTFTVQAVNAIGTSASSSASNSATPSTVPAAPTIGTAVAGDTTATVAWTDNGTGGSAITSHNIISSPATTTQHGSSGMTFTGLTNGVAYTFTVQAVNANGASASSSASNSVTPASAFTPPTDTTFLNNTIAGAGADCRTNLGNWFTIRQNSASNALDAVNYLGSSNSSNTITNGTNNGVHNSTSGLISTSGWKTFGGAFKRGGGNANFLCLYSSADTTNYVIFNLNTVAVDTQAGTATGTAFAAIGQSFAWYRVTFGSAQGANVGAKFAYGDTAAHCTPTTGFAGTSADILICGPWACTT